MPNTVLSDKQTEPDDSAPEDVKSLSEKLFDEGKFFAKLFAGMFLFLMLAWGQYKIPSESMQPTLEVGDHLFVAKFAYGYSRHSLPFGLHKLPITEGKKLFSRLPNRGDVAVFRNPKNELVMIKRVVGLPGDTIAVSGGRLSVNGEMVERETLEAFLYRAHSRNKGRGIVIGVDSYREQLPGEAQTHIIYEQTDQAVLDDAGPFVVPGGTIFFMGDNRDNSVDSRAPLGPGFVPVDHLIGRADLMAFSLKRCKKEEGLRCPGFRAFKPL